MRHPGVSEAAVVGVQVDDASRAKAHVIVAPGTTPARSSPTSCGPGARSTCAAMSSRTSSSSSTTSRGPSTGKIQRFKLREATRPKPCREPDDCFDDLVWMFEVRRMAAAEHETANRMRELHARSHRAARAFRTRPHCPAPAGSERRYSSATTRGSSCESPGRARRRPSRQTRHRVVVIASHPRAELTFGERRLSLAMASRHTSSTNTCGAIATTPATSWPAA